MGLKERKAIFAKIEGHRKRPLISYITSKREGVPANMATDALPFLIDQLDKLPAGTTELDFLIVSNGGDPMVAWRIMSLIRQRLDKVFVLIPQSAYSAATLLALGADEIVMHPNGHLGPVDMQITALVEGRPRQFSTEDISAFIDFVRDRLGVTDQEHVRSLFESTCREVGSIGVGFTARSSKLAVELAEKMLALPSSTEPGAISTRAVLENLSRQFHSHAYPVSRREAIEIGLRVKKDTDAILDALMWELWLDIEEELKERVPFDPIHELLASPQAAAILSPIQQFDFPLNVTPYIQSDIAGLITDCHTVEPIDFEYLHGIMESTRLAQRGAVRGKILAFRQPDMTIHFNYISSFRGWEVTA